MNVIKRYARQMGMDAPMLLVYVAGGYLFGTAVTLLICSFLDTADGFGMIGTLAALVGGVMGLLTRRQMNSHTRFHLVVAMGETRRNFLLWDSVVFAVEALAVVLLVKLFSALEVFLYDILMPGRPNFLDVASDLSMSAVLALSLGLAVLNLFMTAMMNRFGIKGFWAAMLPVYIFCFLVNPALDAYREGRTSVLARLGGAFLSLIDSLSFIPWQVLVVVPCLALVFISVLMLRKAEIKL